MPALAPEGVSVAMSNRVLLAVEHRAASLAAARALHQSGREVWIASAQPRTYAAFSRTVAGRVAVPPAGEDPEGFVSALARASRELQPIAVLPAGEPAALALAGRANAFPAATAVGAVSREVVERAIDKVALLELAAAADLPVPASTHFRRGELEQRADSLGYPVLLKPRRSETRVDGQLELVLACRAQSPDELREALTRLPGDEWVVQRHVEGQLGAVCGVAWRGELVCAMHQRALRTYPADGPSAFAVTTPPDPALEAKVARLVEVVGWSGIFQAQFMHGHSESFLIDFNPRTYGSLALAVAAGLNLPAIWVDLLVGETPSIGAYRFGVRYRSEERDARAILLSLAHGRVGGAARALVPQRGTVHAVFSLRDPLPIFASVGKLLSMSGRTAMRRPQRRDR